MITKWWIYFYDIKNKKIIETKYKIEYSFMTEVNALFLILMIEKENKEILLCACKKIFCHKKSINNLI